MIKSATRRVSRLVKAALVLLVYVFVVLPYSAVYRTRRSRAMSLSPDPVRKSYWIERGPDGDPPEVFSSDDMIVTLRHRSTIRGYLRSVTAVRRSRRFIPAALAGLLAPLRWTRASESPHIDPDIYAMH